MLTQEAFDRLLAWLDPDRENAARRYEQIRARLITIFAGRGCVVADELADITFNRVARRVDEIVTSYAGDPALYFYGVAQKVYLEHVRKKPVPKAIPSAAPDYEMDRNIECLERCLQKLDADSRLLILEYYRGEKRAKIDHRNQLAERLGIAVNALRMRAARVRAALQACIVECLQKEIVH